MPKSLLDYIDAIMCEADDLYLSMHEALAAENASCVIAYSDRLVQSAVVCRALVERLDGATLH